MPSRLRSDRGTENIKVAEWMEEKRGPGGGLLYLGQVSYLLRVLLEPPDKFDRSVHNTRIERMWYDITHGFGMKWKNFFLDLEVNHGLNLQSSDDRWLLHHLFLHRIQEDADEWTQAWNSHKLKIRGEREHSP